jgi:glyoxylase-like metal-dependent hydrolase (beta-lactamase superfamily II)
MKEILPNVFIESGTAGVVLGAVRLTEGILFVDSPLLAKDAQEWRSAHAKPSSSYERMLILLDEHPDRTIGAKAMKSTLVAHEKTAQLIGNRPLASKPFNTHNGAAWEYCNQLGSIHWVQPEITFTHSLFIHWGDEPAILEYHPGPSKGASWLGLPEQKLFFIGDCVTVSQPPFLTSADLTAWLETLTLLRSAKFREAILIGSRDGLVTQEEVKAMIALLNRIKNKLSKLADSMEPSTVDGFAVELAGEYKARNEKEAEMFKTRLICGLQHQYLNFHPTKEKGKRRVEK